MSQQDVSNSLEEFVAELRHEVSAYRGPECRKEKRAETPPIPVVVSPLNEAMEPDGKPFSAVLRNLSDGGIGLSFGERVEAEYIEITGVLHSGRIFTTVIHVRHCTPAGVMIGGEFIKSHRHKIV